MYSILHYLSLVSIPLLNQLTDLLPLYLDSSSYQSVISKFNPFFKSLISNIETPNVKNVSFTVGGIHYEAEVKSLSSQVYSFNLHRNQLYCVSGVIKNSSICYLYICNDENECIDNTDGSRSVGKRNADGSFTGIMYNNENVIEYIGTMIDNEKNGFGIHFTTSSPCYIGFFSNDKYNGYGGLFDLKGDLKNFGYWVDGELLSSQMNWGVQNTMDNIIRY